MSENVDYKNVFKNDDLEKREQVFTKKWIELINSDQKNFGITIVKKEETG